MKLNVVTTTLIAFTLGACGTTQNVGELNEQVDYYKYQALEADSIRMENSKLKEEKRMADARINSLTEEIQRLRAENGNLNSNYQQVLTRYNQQMDDHHQVVTNTSYEKLSLQEELAKKQLELEERERRLAQAEYVLRNQGNAAGITAYNATLVKGIPEGNSKKAGELEAAMTLKEQKISQIEQDLNQALSEFSRDEISISRLNGRLHLTLGHQLLFENTNDELGWRGKKVLMQLASVLKANTNLDIVIEGHMDKEGTAARNWDLSVLKATSIVKALTLYGVPPEEMAAAGRGYHDPIIQNQEQGSILNRRCEIIIAPVMDDLYQIMEN